MRRRWVVLSVLIAVVASVAAAVLLPRKSDGVPTVKIEPVQFSRRVTAEGTLKAVKATPVSVPQDAPGPLKLSSIADDGAVLAKDSVVAQFDPTEFETLLLTGNEDRSAARNTLRKADTDAGATKTNLIRDAGQAQFELEAAARFRFDDSEVFSRYQRIESEVDTELARRRKGHAEEVLGVRESLAAAERDLITIDDRKAGIKIKQAEDGLRSLQVLAPHPGIFVLQRNWRGETRRVGDTLWPGETIGEIPDLSSMQAEIFVLEADAAGLAPDQKVTLTVESRSGVQFHGKVKSVEKIARPRFRNVPVQYFGVTVSLDRTDAALMKPGARVRAVLEVEKQAGAFAVPRQALFDREGKKIVYRRRGETFEPVEVTIGSSTAGRVVVTKGLKAGDELAMQAPDGDDAAGERGARL